MGIKFTNNFLGTLAAGLAPLDTTVTLGSGEGAQLPTYGSGDYEYMTLFNASNDMEIVKVTARTGDDLTVVRAQDGTTALTWLTGDFINARPCAAAMNDALQVNVAKANVDSQAFTGTPSLPTGTTGVTQAAGDSTSKLATTAFVVGAIDDLRDELAVAGSTTVNTYNTAGASTWNKPASGTMALIECWGAGGSGGRNYSSGGGGGGAYASRLFRLADLPASVTVTVGAGGASKTSNGNGNAGQDTTFGTYVTGKGGGGGASASLGLSASGGAGGIGGNNGSDGGAVTIGDFATASAGNSSYDGGAGGGAQAHALYALFSAGGTAYGRGGAGGTGATAPSGSGGNGAAPGGGGGGSYSGNSGAGARGQCIVTVW